MKFRFASIILLILFIVNVYNVLAVTPVVPSSIYIKSEEQHVLTVYEIFKVMVYNIYMSNEEHCVELCEKAYKFLINVVLPVQEKDINTRGNLFFIFLGLGIVFLILSKVILRYSEEVSVVFILVSILFLIPCLVPTIHFLNSGIVHLEDLNYCKEVLEKIINSHTCDIDLVLTCYSRIANW